MISREDQLKKPCGTCPIDMRDHCWKGRAFACEDYYSWLRKVIQSSGGKAK